MLPILRVVWWLIALAGVLEPLSAAADPPARVGRLSLAEGGVVFHIDRRDPGSAATYNWPISSGAILETDPGGRAEVQVGSSIFRLAGDSRVEFTVVDDSRIALQVEQGSLAAAVRDPSQVREVDIGTPAGRVRFGTTGRYRIDVHGPEESVYISAREGGAHLNGPGGELGIPNGRRAVVDADGSWFLEEVAQDGFDAWVDARDAAGDAPVARRYVSPEMTGYEDLDRYGDWASAPDYGVLWYPRTVPADWAPYRYGRWAWVQPWGWTWVDQALWGFAPFHYGRWLLIGGRWAWAPGGYIRRPVYAPALVAWIGDPGWSVGAAPAVGWFPLAPREVFIPAYRCSPAYVRRANINHVTDAAAINRAVSHSHAHRAFANRAQPQAVTMVAADVVRQGTPISQARVWRPDRQQLLRAPATSRAPEAARPTPAEAVRRPGRQVGAHPATTFPPPTVSTTAPVTSAAAPMAPSSQTVPSAPAVTVRRHDRPDAPHALPHEAARGFPAATRSQATLAPTAPQPARPAMVEPGRVRPAPVQVLPPPREIAPVAPLHVPAAREMPRVEARPAAPRESRHEHGKPPNAR